MKRPLGRWPVLLAAAVLLFGCGESVSGSTPSPPAKVSTVSPAPGAVQYPDSLITPGLPIITHSSADVCTTGWAKRHRVNLPDADKQAVAAAYGLKRGQRVAEWDHLVPLELGGGNGPLNVWPMLSPEQKTEKNHLENQLHAEVCSGAISLETAQSWIIRYWEHW